MDHQQYLHEVFPAGRLAMNRTDEFLRCWGKQTCDACLDTEGCTWCPFTWVCVPNNHTYPLLAPFHENVCPHRLEQWEIRTHPFGCNVSSRNFVSVVVAILLTLVFAALVAVLIWGTGRLRALSKQHPGWLGHLVSLVKHTLSKSWWRRKGGAEAEALLAGGAGGEDILPEQV